MERQVRVFRLMVWAMTFGCAATTPEPRAQERGTPVHADAACKELPSVEACQETAESIQDDRLRACVAQQCSRIQVRCNAMTEALCAAHDRRRPSGRKVLGISSIGSCEAPNRLIVWCSRQFKDPRRAARCAEDAFVHELAHSCGFRHDEDALQEGQMHDLGVPGHDGSLRNCPVQEGGSR
ncbi:hypothetical protein [Corallococcus terminator]|nr:hypothetical protein [Corallococcus terminator]